MTSTVQESIEVHVPIRTAYNQWTQFESFPHFMDGVEAISQLDATHTHWKIKVAGREREFDATITEQLPDERVAWKSTEGATHAGVVTFHRLGDDDTRVTVQMDWQPEGFTEKAGAAIGADDRQVKADLRRFKAFIEHRQGETGAWRGEVPRPDAAGGAADSTASAYGDQQYGSGSGAAGGGYGQPAGGQGYGAGSETPGNDAPSGDQGYGSSAPGAGSGASSGDQGYGTPPPPPAPGRSAGGW
jgi:hypothetical protein